jgi:hypothetical protein
VIVSPCLPEAESGMGLPVGFPGFHPPCQVGADDQVPFSGVAIDDVGVLGFDAAGNLTDAGQPERVS